MNLKLIRLVFFIGIGVFAREVNHAQTCNSIGDGAWNNTSTWNCNGVNRIPTCGDTVLITAGDVINVVDQNNYEACGAAMILDISGEMAFSNGNKLELPCGSLMSIQSGGAVYKSSAGGGTSTLISICNANIWTAADGRLDGPISFGGFVLPVELISFKAAFIAADRVRLQWVTASEVNSDNFTLYSGRDTQSWTELKRIPAAGFSNTERYYEIILPAHLLSGNLIRMEQTDYDGATEALGVIRLDDARQERLAAGVWPNPSSGVLYVEVDDYDAALSVLLYNQQGALLQSWPIERSENRKRIDLAPLGLARGVYYLQVISTYGVSTTKLQLQSSL